MYERHPSLAFQEVNVIDDLYAPAVHIQNCLAHQVLIDKQPARLVHERRILLALLRRLDNYGILLELDDPVPGNQLAWFSPAVVDVYANGLRVRFSHTKYQVGEFSDFKGTTRLAHGPSENLGKEKGTVVPSIGCDGFYSVRIHYHTFI